MNSDWDIKNNKANVSKPTANSAQSPDFAGLSEMREAFAFSDNPFHRHEHCEDVRFDQSLSPRFISEGIWPKETAMMVDGAVDGENSTASGSPSWPMEASTNAAKLAAVKKQMNVRKMIKILHVFPPLKDEDEK